MPNFEISPIRHTLDSKHSLTRDYKINPLPNFETIYQRSHNSNRVNSDDASDQSEHSSFCSSLYLLHVIFHYQHHPAKKRNEEGRRNRFDFSTLSFVLLRFSMRNVGYYSNRDTYADRIDRRSFHVSRGC